MGIEQLEAAGENRRVRVDWAERDSRGMYSPRLVKAMLKALGKQLDDDGRLDRVCTQLDQ